MNVVIYIRRPPQQQRGQLGANESDVRLFTFWWTDVSAGWFGTLRGPHATFNQAFARQFPRQFYTNPSTSYTDQGIIGVRSQLTGTGETQADDAGIRDWILSAAANAGIYGDGDASKLTISSHTIAEIQGGASLQLPPSTVNPLATTDGVHDLLGGLDPWEAFLGIGGTTAAAIGLVLLVLILKK